MIIKKHKVPIMAAEEDRFGFGADDDMLDDAPDTTSDDNSSSIKDDISNIADDIDELKEALQEDISQDNPSIDIDNNIENHYIAECELCKGIFISAVVHTGQKLNKISGVCPLCEKESDQLLKWVVTKADEANNF